MQRGLFRYDVTACETKVHISVSFFGPYLVGMLFGSSRAEYLFRRDMRFIQFLVISWS